MREAIDRSRKTQPNAVCTTELLRILDPERGKVKSQRARLEALLQAVLTLDVLEFEIRGKGVAKPSLSATNLKEAANTWRRCYVKAVGKAKAGEDVDPAAPYAVLWNGLKRATLRACGLQVLRAPSLRYYFEEPHARTQAEHIPEREGRWREQVVAPSPYSPEIEEGGEAAPSRSYVATAANEQAMGRVDGRELEVPLPFDEGALDSPDKGTKTEWDALHVYSDLLSQVPIGDQAALRLDDDQMIQWVLPQSGGGLRNADYEDLLRKHRRTSVLTASEGAVTLASLDPTQRAFADAAIAWGCSWRDLPTYDEQVLPDVPFNSLLLGTAGTGKTTTLKAVLQEWERVGFGKVLVAAFTGVAASNIGMGAKTLHSLFRLASAGVDLEGDALAEFLADMDGVRCLIIDEISMVSKVILAQVSARLQQWRHQAGLPGADAPFGGIGVL